MTNYVITFTFNKGKIYQLVSEKEYEKIRSIWSLEILSDILLNDESNCLNVGENPSEVVIDKYEDAELVSIVSEKGSLMSFLGETYDYKLRGKKIETLHVFSQVSNILLPS